MKKNKFLCIGWLPFLICTLLLLVITAFMKARDVEQKVKASAVAALSDERFSWSTIETYNLGREVLIAGNAPNEDVIKEAVNLVEQAPGVLWASHNGEAIASVELSSPELKVAIAGNTLELTGELANQADINSVVESAKRAFNNHAITNSLTIGENIAALPDTNFLSGLNLSSQIPRKISAELKQQSLYLTGAVATSSVSTLIESRLREIFSGNINNELTVDRKLCSELIDDVLSKEKINFDTDKASVSASSFELLNKVVAAAKRCPNVSYDVAGHTDSSGNLDYNLRLSQQRAQSVVTLLAERGLNESQFNAKGYGPNQPIGDNDTVEGRAKNRRIEFKISN